jgi:hypothetical protein
MTRVSTFRLVLGAVSVLSAVGVLYIVCVTSDEWAPLLTEVVRSF